MSDSLSEVRPPYARRREASTRCVRRQRRRSRGSGRRCTSPHRPISTRRRGTRSLRRASRSSGADRASAAPRRTDDARLHLRARRVDRLASGRDPLHDGEAATRERTRGAGASVRPDCVGRVPARIEPPGRLEGGDVIWLDERTLAVGRGYRTNAEGIRQLRALVGRSRGGRSKCRCPTGAARAT